VHWLVTVAVECKGLSHSVECDMRLPIRLSCNLLMLAEMQFAYNKLAPCIGSPQRSGAVAFL
jgi:hypothetical protein